MFDIEHRLFICGQEKLQQRTERLLNEATQAGYEVQRRKDDNTRLTGGKEVQVILRCDALKSRAGVCIGEGGG